MGGRNEAIGGPRIMGGRNEAIGGPCMMGGRKEAIGGPRMMGGLMGAGGNSMKNVSGSLPAATAASFNCFVIPSSSELMSSFSCSVMCRGC